MFCGYCFVEYSANIHCRVIEVYTTAALIWLWFFYCNCLKGKYRTQWEPFIEQFSHYPLGVSTCSQFKKIHMCRDDRVQWHRKMLINQKLPTKLTILMNIFHLFRSNSVNYEHVLLLGSICCNTMPITPLTLEPMSHCEHM